MSAVKQLAKVKSPFGKVFAIRGVSEIAATSCALGAVTVLEKVAPNQLDKLYSAVAKTIIEPNIGFFEGALDKALPGFKSANHEQWRSETDPERRAKSYAKSMTDLGVIMFGTALAAQALTQRGMEALIKVPQVNPIEMKAWDYAAQSTTFGLMNMVFSKPTREMQAKTAGFLQERFGMDEEMANERARYIVNINIPNLAGFSFGVFQHNKAVKALLNEGAQRA